MNRAICFILLASISLAFSAQAGGKKFSENINRSLYSDRRAYEVGDVVTVLIMEFSIGSHEAGTETETQNDLGLMAAGSGELADLNYGASGQWNHRSDGEGETKRSGNLQGTIAARIVEITSNANLVIEGARTIIINGEKQVTTLRGVVRPEDISGQNTVYSYNVAEAEIGYTGKGDVNGAARPGIFTRIINWIF